MDATRFDGFVRALAVLPRRDVLRWGLGFGVTGLAAGVLRGDTVAKNGRKRRKCKGDTRRCGKRCIPLVDCCSDDDCPGETVCQGGACTCPAANQVACGDQCVNLTTDANNCGDCGFTCASGECVNGACTCNGGQSQCLSGCACADRIGGGKVCFKGGNNGTNCNSDSDCPFRSLCFSIGKCSIPCVA